MKTNSTVIYKTTKLISKQLENGGSQIKKNKKITKKIINV